MESKSITLNDHYEDDVLSSFQVLHVDIPPSEFVKNCITTSDLESLCLKLIIKVSFKKRGLISRNTITHFDQLCIRDAYKQYLPRRVMNAVFAYYEASIKDKETTQ